MRSAPNRIQRCAEWQEAASGNPDTAFMAHKVEESGPAAVYRAVTLSSSVSASCSWTNSRAKPSSRFRTTRACTLPSDTSDFSGERVSAETRPRKDIRAGPAAYSDQRGPGNAGHSPFGTLRALSLSGWYFRLARSKFTLSSSYRSAARS